MRSPFQSHQWQSNMFACDSNDLDHCQAMLAEEAQRLGMQQLQLGEMGKFPLLMYQSPAPHAEIPSVLICAGFHGEEAAGPWGVVNWLMKQRPELFDRVNISLLPVINPAGFRKGQRYNRHGMNPNQGFVLEHGRPKIHDDASEETRILHANSQLLQAASRDGVLSCHEDIQAHDAYLATFEPRCQPGAFSLAMRTTLARHFPIALPAAAQAESVALEAVAETALVPAMADASPSLASVPVSAMPPLSSQASIPCDEQLTPQGIIFNRFDTSFGAFLVRSGARFAVSSHTPAQAEFDRRILANSALIETFISHILD